MTPSGNKFVGVNRIRQIMPIAVLLFGSAFLVAQYQVNRQINRGGGPPSVRYANSYGSSPYGGNPYGSNPYGSNPYGAALYGGPANRSASSMLPSQQRYAVARSGALPSDIRMNYGQVGPMAPSGAVAYLPASPGYPAPRSVNSGNFVNPQAARPAAAMPGFTSPAAGSVKYAPAPAYQSSLTPSSSLGVSARSGVPSGQVSHSQPMSGSIRYGSQ